MACRMSDLKRPFPDFARPSSVASQREQADNNSLKSVTKTERKKAGECEEDQGAPSSHFEDTHPDS